MKNKAFTLIELLVIVAILAILSALVLGSGGCSVSDGQRVGVITKFSHKGMTAATKSWEGELALGGARSTTDSSGVASIVANVWSFSVYDAKVVEKIDKLQESGHRAKLVYHQTLGHNPLSRDTSYVVTEAIDLDVTLEKK